MVRIRLQSRGFTLIEIMVVIGIIGILAAIVSVNFSSTTAVSRDAKRQADIRQIQAALEAYKNKNGRYPAQCAATGANADGWSGQIGTDYECDNNTGEYIVGLAPEYISVLPVDPKLSGTNSGYVYRVDSAGQVYKIMAMRTVEAETVAWNHEFASCQLFADPATSGSSDIRVVGWCAKVAFSGNNIPPQCDPPDSRFQTSYGAWGGFAPYALSVTVDSAPNADQRNRTVRNTTDVICR